MFPSLNKRIADAVKRLQYQLENGADVASPEEVERAQEALVAAKEKQ